MSKIVSAAKSRLQKRSTWLVVAVGSLAAVGGAVAFAMASAAPPGLHGSLAAAFPKTKITSIECRMQISGLCEVIAGRNVFYASRDGRFVVVGSILDLSKKVDMTDERLKQLAAVDVATNGIAAKPDSDGSGGEAQPPTKIEVTLPVSNAIVHNPGAKLKVKVFSDFSCGYCRALFTELAADRSVEVTEYPIAVLGDQSAERARLVLCARDRVSASHSAYTAGDIRTSGDCARAAAMVAENTQFARAHGISGTPTIIRGDGTVNAGYLGTDALKAFAGGRS